MAVSHLLVHWNTNQVTLAIIVGASVLFTLLFRYLLHKDAFPKNTPPPTTLSWPIVGALGLFTQRAEWMEQAQAESKTGHFSFYAGPHSVTGICGKTEEPRKLFFEDRRLGFYEGYQGMLAGAPSAESNEIATGEETTETAAFIAKFKARLTAMMKGNKLFENLPGLLQDVDGAMKNLGNNQRGLTDPFETIYRMVYQLTMRNVGCKEVTDSPEMISKTLRLFEDVEEASNALMIMFPWLPQWAKVRRMYSGVRLYLIFKKLVEKRQKEARRENDAVQYLLDHGDSVTDTIQVRLPFKPVPSRRSSFYCSSVDLMSTRADYDRTVRCCCALLRHAQYWDQCCLDRHLPCSISRMESSSTGRSEGSSR